MFHVVPGRITEIGQTEIPCIKCIEKLKKDVVSHEWAELFGTDHADNPVLEKKSVVTTTVFREEGSGGNSTIQYFHACSTCGAEKVYYSTVNMDIVKSAFELRRIEMNWFGKSPIKIDAEARLEEILQRVCTHGPIGKDDLIDIIDGDGIISEPDQDRWDEI
jgi:hypothetical protein